MKRICLYLLCLSLASCHVNLGGDSKVGTERNQKPGIGDFSGNYWGTCSIVTPTNASPKCHFTLSAQSSAGFQTIRLLVHGRDEYWFSFSIGDGLSVSAVNQVKRDGVMVDLNPGYNVKTLDPKIEDGVLVFNVTSETAHGPQLYSFKLETHRYGTQFEIKDKLTGIYLTGSTSFVLPNTTSPRELIRPIVVNEGQAAIFYSAQREKPPIVANEYRGLRVQSPRAVVDGQSLPIASGPDEFCEFLSEPGTRIYSGAIAETETHLLRQGERVARFVRVNEGTELEHLGLETAVLDDDLEIASEFTCTGGTF